VLIAESATSARCPVKSPGNISGTRRAPKDVMTGAKNHKELIVWQVADELRMKVYQLTAGRPASRDFKFCDQLRDAVGGIPSNIAEGFRPEKLDRLRAVYYLCLHGHGRD